MLQNKPWGIADFWAQKWLSHVLPSPACQIGSYPHHWPNYRVITALFPQTRRQKLARQYFVFVLKGVPTFKQFSTITAWFVQGTDSLVILESCGSFALAFAQRWHSRLGHATSEQHIVGLQKSSDVILGQLHMYSGFEQHTFNGKQVATTRNCKNARQSAQSAMKLLVPVSLMQACTDRQ